MLPVLSSMNAVNHFAPDVETCGDFSTVKVGIKAQVSDLTHIIFCELCTAVFAAPMWHLATLAVTVMAIISIRSKKEMFGIYTRRVIAPVTNKQSVRDRAIVHNVREAVRHDLMPFRAVSPHGKVKTAVAAQFVSEPQPACCGFKNAPNNTLAKRQMRVTARPRTTRLTAKSLATAREGDCKFLAAKLAIRCYDRLSHDKNLLERFKLWSGSFRRRNLLSEPFCIIA